MATYILQKDLPDVKAGAKGLVNENGLLCFYENELTGEPEYFFPKESYENNPDWFKLKEEKKVKLFDQIFYSKNDMRKCWETCMEVTEESVGGNYSTPPRITFKDYINSLNK
jgi:hypothetical protein